MHVAGKSRRRVRDDGRWEARVGDASAIAVREASAGWRPRFVEPAEGLGAAGAGRATYDIGFWTQLWLLGRDRVLIDAGLGDLESAWVRRFAESFDRFQRGAPLAAALELRGLDADDVTHVVLTHAHLDHLAGAFEGIGETTGETPRPRFRRAQHFLHTLDRVACRYDGRPNPDGDRWLDALDRARLLTLVEGPTEITSGVRVAPAPGESPGHQVVWLERLGESLVHLGDLVHVPDELRAPSLVPLGRAAGPLVASRRAVLDEAAARRALVTFTHAAEAPFGLVEPVDPGYSWSPRWSPR